MAQIGGERLAALFGRMAPGYRRGLEELMQTGAAAGRPEVIAAIDPRPGMRILDLACGPGVLSIPLAAALEGHGEVVGVDLSDGMLAEARHAVAGRNLPLRFARGDFERLNFPPGTFDAVACGHGLQFAGNLGRTLREIRRVLKPRGVMAASVPVELGPRTAVEEAVEKVLEERLGPPPATSFSSAREVTANPELFRRELVMAGLREASARPVDLTQEYRDPEVYVDRALGWWTVVLRMEPMHAAQRDEVRQAAIAAARHASGGAPFKVTRHALVATARS